VPPPPRTAAEREAEGRRAYVGLRMSAVGMELGLSVVVGYGLGWFVDSRAGTGPWGGIVGIALGFTAGIRSILRTVKIAERAAARATEPAGWPRSEPPTTTPPPKDSHAPR